MKVPSTVAFEYIQIFWLYLQKQAVALSLCFCPFSSSSVNFLMNWESYVESSTHAHNQNVNRGRQTDIDTSRTDRYWFRLELHGFHFRSLLETGYFHRYTVYRHFRELYLSVLFPAFGFTFLYWVLCPLSSNISSKTIPKNVQCWLFCCSFWERVDQSQSGFAQIGFSFWPSQCYTS